jgi:hypothetical protein
MRPSSLAGVKVCSCFDFVGTGALNLTHPDKILILPGGQSEGSGYPSPQDFQAMAKKNLLALKGGLARIF